MAKDKQKNVVITGASRGIGFATAQLFHDKGWRVITCARGPLPKNVPWDASTHIRLDLADPDATMKAISQFQGMLDGRLDALVNNAGVSPKGARGVRLNTLTTDLTDWGKVFHVNFFAPIVLARGLREELATAMGAVVNVTSIAGARVHPFAGAAYATSKAALGAVTREMAHDFGPLGVRVNAVAPGEVETDILSPGSRQLAKELPLKRLGQPEEVAAAILYLCCGDASYVSGAELEVNGAQHV